MSTKKAVLTLLQTNQHTYSSGSALATTLNLSRNSVWKAVKSLQADGYHIDAIKNKGYQLRQNQDVISAAGIRHHLTHPEDFNIHVFDRVNSTNTLLKEAADQAAKQGTVIISTHQTNGKGRLGRQFYSPSQTGIYFSFLLRPTLGFDQTTYLTALAGISTCEAIQTLTHQDAKIKWVNDIFIHDKKVSGILTEATLSLENQCLDYLVIGIGINVYAPTTPFPAELKEVASYVCDEITPDLKNQIVAFILNHFFAHYHAFNPKKIATEYRNKSCLIGRDIYVHQHQNIKKATVKTINDRCELVVTYPDHTTEALHSAEVSTKLLK